MSVTVQELLKLPIMQENSKVVSEYGLDNIVRYVTVAEAHDVHFPSFGGGVFVLTTLSAHHGSTEEIDEFIQGLCNVKVSGIGIKLGRFVNEIPASTIRLAREANVPIVALSSTVYFREILSDTLSVITGNQQQMLNRINALSRTMVNAIVENQNIQQLLRLFCQEVNCYCCCMDLSGRWIAEAASLCGVFDTKEVKRELENYIAQQGQVRQYYHKGNIFIFPCIVQGEFLAAFCMAAYDVEEELACSLAQSVVNGINIKFLGENLKQQAEMELISSTLDDVLFSHGSDPKIIAERLSLVDFVPRKNLLMILVSSEAAQRYARSYMHRLNGIQSVFSERFASCVTFRHSNKFLVLASCEQTLAKEKLCSILKDCHSMLQKYEDEVFDIGCSTQVTDLTRISECYTMAKDAITFGRMEDAEAHVYYYGDYFELGLIAHGVGSEEEKMFFERVTSPIRLYDEQFGNELWHTLEVSLSNLKLEQAAECLHIHISTLRYRLQKIEALTGYNYFHSRDRLTLYLAYLLYRISSDGAGQ